MSSLFALRALLFAAECLAASVLILGLAWLGNTYLKRASLRHLVWLGAFGALLVLPVAALIVPPRIVLERAAVAPEPLPSFIEPAAAAPAPAIDVTPAPAPARSWQPNMRDAAIALFAVWLAGVLWQCCVWRWARSASRRCAAKAGRMRSRPPTCRAFRTAANANCACRSARDGPMTWGVLRPVILLPKDSLSWPRGRLQAVLLHELAHVRRRDSLVQSLALIVCALYWPNPLVWIAARALRREAEIAADDAAIVSGIRPSPMPASSSSWRPNSAAAMPHFSGVSMAGSALEARVKSALAPNRTRTGVTSMDALKIAFFGIAATAALALARPDIVQAQGRERRSAAAAGRSPQRAAASASAPAGARSDARAACAARHGDRLR